MIPTQIILVQVQSKNFNLFPQTFLKFHLSKKIKKLQTLKNFEFGSSSDSLQYFKPSKNFTLKFGPKNTNRK